MPRRAHRSTARLAPRRAPRHASRGATALATLFLIASAVAAVPPPPRMNYQGVLRTQAGVPVDGTHAMTFRFFDAEAGGAELLVDVHSGADAVVVAGGLFNVDLGGGATSDGSGPGSYTVLDTLFRDQPTVWMQVEVAGEVLLPRVEVLASAYAMQASNAAFAQAAGVADDSAALGGVAAGAFLRSDQDDSAQGRIAFQGASTGNHILGGAVTIQPSSATGLDTVLGIQVAGQSRMWVNALGTLYTVSDDWGVYGRGSSGGGYFRDRESTGYAYLGIGDRGIEAHGNSGGGYFTDLNGSGRAYVGSGDTGVEGSGAYTGGFFYDNDGSGYAYLGTGDTGLRGSGNSAGGLFTDIDSSGYAYAGYGDYGVWAAGNFAGAYFEDSNSTGYAYLGYSNYGVRGYGTSVGGLFADSDGSGYAWVGHNDYGIDAYGNAGAYFKELDTGTYAWLADSSIGVSGEGESQGGYFRDIDAGTYVRTGYGSASVWGNGTKNFVQNHPYDRSKTVVYAALEGDEVGTYTRGTARLVDGQVTIRLGESFGWVTNPDIGLTAQLTPRGPDAGLYVEALSTTELVVGGNAGSDAAFDFVVFGLRVGFEASSVVREKDLDAYLPSMEDDARMFARDPELQRFTALERFKDMEADVRGLDRATFDLSAGVALADAIGRFDPAQHRPRDADRPRSGAPLPDAARASAAAGREGGVAGPAGPAGPPADARDAGAGFAAGAAPTIASSGTSEPEGETGSMAEADRLDRVDVSERVEPGDVLTVDPDRPGMLRRTATMADPGLVGVAVAPAGDRSTPLRSSGIARVKVDAGYGAIRPGDLLTSSPTAGHAMRALEALPGTVLGKALDGLDAGTGTVRVVLALR